MVNRTRMGNALFTMLAVRTLAMKWISSRLTLHTSFASPSLSSERNFVSRAALLLTPDERYGHAAPESCPLPPALSNMTAFFDMQTVLDSDSMTALYMPTGKPALADGALRSKSGSWTLMWPEGLFARSLYPPHASKVDQMLGLTQA